MSMRKITSLTALLSFLIVLLTSIILYIVPQGRVAYWADWRLWGMSKEQWGAIHINVGILFLLSLLLHIYYNWKPVVSYLKNKSRQIKIFTGEFNIALLLVIICIIGTYIEFPPFSTVMMINGKFKESAARKYGEPPYGHAELSSLKSFAKKTDIDLNSGMELLKKAGYKISGETQSLKEIAENNGIPPQQIYMAMMPASAGSDGFSGKPRTFPEKPVPGTGNLTLADLCSRYGLDIKSIISSLRESDIMLEEDMTIRKIGETNKINPADIYEKIKSAAGNQIGNSVR